MTNLNKKHNYDWARILSSVSNHLDFLSALRGKVELENDFAILNSERPEFSLTYQKHPEANIINLRDDSKQLYFFDSSHKLNNEAIKHGFQKTGSINHMIFEGKVPTMLRKSEPFIIKEVKTADEMEIFGETQCRGFLPDEASYANWAAWLKKMNQINLGMPNQRFLIAFDCKIPVSVTLEIIRPESVGVYAVATHPLFRNKGASTHLLQHTLGTYRDKIICLQVASDSYAQHFYSKLGFENLIKINIYNKAYK